MQKIKNVRWVGGVAFGRKIVGGREITKCLETSDARVAQQRVKKWLKDMADARWAARSEQRFISDAIVYAKKHHWPTIDIETRKRYNVSLGNDLLLDLIMGRKLQELSHQHLTDFVTARRLGGVTNPTIRRDLAALSVVYEAAIDAGWIEINPVGSFMKRAAKKRGLKENAARTRITSYEESAAVIQASIRMPCRSTHTRVLLAAYLIVVLETGLRADELLNQRYRWVDYRRQEIFVPKQLAKRNKERWVPLRPAAIEALRWLETNVKCPDDDLIFWSNSLGADGQRRPLSSLYYAFQDACAYAKVVEHLTLHDLRRTCGARLLRDGMRMEEVSMWLGHSDIRVTQRHYAFLGRDSLHKAVGIKIDPEFRPVIEPQKLLGIGMGMEVTEEAQVVESAELMLS